MKQKEVLKQLRALDSKLLAKELAESNKKLVTLRFSAKLRKLKNVKEIQTERKKVAVIWTLLGEKAMEELIKTEESKGKVINGETK